MATRTNMTFARIADEPPEDPFLGLEDGPAVGDWPRFTDLGLSDRLRALRQLGLGGSDANIVLSGDRAAILDLWRQKRGEAPGPDLSSKLPVALGLWTEEFNRQWVEKLRGKKIDGRGVSITCPTDPWRRCSLDGIITEDNAIWEAKHTNAFASSEEVLTRYMPQLQHNMAVADLDRAILSVIFGNHKFEIFEVASDWIYQIELLEAEREFWDCVITGREPVPAPPPTSPRVIGTREVCLEGSNAWAAAAADWLEHRAAAKVHASACTTIKVMVEDDVARAFGHGIEAKRSKSGAISIRELKA